MTPARGRRERKEAKGLRKVQKRRERASRGDQPVLGPTALQRKLELV